MKSNELIDNLNWFENICKWADDNNIKNLDRYKRGIPRNKEKLFALKELDLSEFDITYLPKEIWYYKIGVLRNESKHIQLLVKYD